MDTNSRSRTQSQRAENGMRSLRVVIVVGARPNFMKAAPLHERMRAHPDVEPYIVHTGQHYDHAMSELFFDHLLLPKPHCYLRVGSGSHGEQTAKIMMRFEKTMNKMQPDLVVVVGDVNSTIACGLVAVKMGIKLAHVEAGLRSFDRTMPEEINRVLTDQISDYLFITEASAQENLRREGIEEEKIFFVGNVMIDSLLKHREKARESRILDNLGLTTRRFVLVTLHRPSNVDDPQMLSGLLDMLSRLSEQTQVVFPVHPRTRARIDTLGISEQLERFRDLQLIRPLGYLDFLKCMDSATLVLTDSGGIQEETTVLGVPCVTARENTERPVTVTEGTNVVAGRNPEQVYQAVIRILEGKIKRGQRPALWDGHAAERIVKVLSEAKELIDVYRPGQSIAG